MVKHPSVPIILQEERKLREAFEPEQTFTELEPPKLTKDQLVETI